MSEKYKFIQLNKHYESFLKSFALDPRCEIIIQSDKLSERGSILRLSADNMDELSCLKEELEIKAMLFEKNYGDNISVTSVGTKPIMQNNQYVQFLYIKFEPVQFN